jgi:hypothetical protein
MDPALLRNIALETNDQGAADAQMALVARRMIDRNGQVQLNPDDLPASMRALGGGGAVPMWSKYSVTAAQFLAAAADPENDVVATVEIEVLPQFTVIHEYVVNHSQAFPGLTMSPTIAVEADIAGVGVAQIANYAGIREVPSPLDFMLTERILDSGAHRIIRGASAILRATLTLDEGALEDLTDGIFDFWLLLSKLPG